MTSKRKLSAASLETEEPVDPSDELMFLCLGGGNEVGRSCHIIQYKGKTVMLDAGMHPAYEGLASLPYYDEFDLSTVDVLLISHFHVDHAASLPYVLAKTNFRGRVFMTHPTKAIYKWLIQDSVRVGTTASSSSDQRTDLYTEADHFATFPRIEAIDYYTTHTISSIRITPYPAGHVLGAAMFLIEIAGLKILFTGDYSREDDRHLISAEVPKNVKIDVLITESTYGIASHVPRVERETALMKSITGILARKGHVLMPVFALGRAQELLLILDEYWGRHPELQRIPIYYASNLARKCMVVYQTYVGAMNDNIKRLFRERMAEAEQAGDVGKGGPWDFRFIRSLKNLERFDDGGSCVVLASPGMLQNGISRELLERWAPDQRNGVVITGYSVEGTMAKEIMTEPESIPAIMSNRNVGAITRAGRLGGAEGEKTMIPRRCSVQEFSFAAHVDGQENKDFIEAVAAPVVILVHGEKHNMMRLKSKLLSLNADKVVKTKIYSPANAEELHIPFRSDKTAKVVGKLAQIPPPMFQPGEDSDDETKESSPSRLVSGVLVANDFKLSLMAPEDLREYAGLSTTMLACRQRITLACASAELVRWALAGTFGSIEDIETIKEIEDDEINGHEKEANGDGEEMDVDEEKKEKTSYAWRIMGCVTVRYENRGDVSVEWEGNMLNDGIADAVMAVLLTVESSPAAVKHSSRSHNHSHTPPNLHSNLTPEERFSRFCMFLEAQFGAAALHPIEQPRLKKSASSSSSDSSDSSDSDTSSTASPSPAAIKAELARLHALGLPVPGVEIRADAKRGYVARVWLEGLDVECASAVFRQRVAAVVQRAAETVAPLWGAGPGAAAAAVEGGGGKGD